VALAVGQESDVQTAMFFQIPLKPGPLNRSAAAVSAWRLSDPVSPRSEDMKSVNCCGWSTRNAGCDGPIGTFASISVYIAL